VSGRGEFFRVSSALLLPSYSSQSFFVYYESIKRELERRPIYECRCDERLKTKAESQAFYFYYESIKREVKIRPIYECRCDERLKTKAEEFTRLTYTGLLGGLELGT
jgi:hypothetical protein